MKPVLSLIVSVAIIGFGSSGPLSTEFMWVPTDYGTLAPAFLKNNPEVPQAEQHVYFYLLTKKNPNTENANELIPFDDASLDGSNYISGAPLKIVSHGFASNWDGPLGQVMKDGFLGLSEDVNVILIDWSRLAAAPWYENAAKNTKVTASKTGKLINFLMQRGVVSRDQIHFIGHSLGSHIGGFVKDTMVNGRPARISSLDPALPLFGEKTDDERIDPTDADFVDVIHSAAGTLFDGGLAFLEPRGHVDFYPNSGKPPMPGCKDSGDFFGSCSHGRAYLYYAESITRQNAFTSCKCEDWEEYDSGSCGCTETAPMGYATSPQDSGLYYLRTNANSPYSQG